MSLSKQTRVKKNARKRNKQLIFRMWGPRCPEFHGLCPTCVAWQIFDATGRYTNYVNLVHEVQLRGKFT